MTCDEAQALFGLISESEGDELSKRRLQKHLATCLSCAAAYEYWQDHEDWMQVIREEVPEAQAEHINRTVMDRIYRESPWLIQDQGKPFEVPASARRRLSWWIGGSIVIFASSILYFMISYLWPGTDDLSAPTGLLPTGIAGHGEVFSYNIPEESRGIVEPLVANIDPTHPVYWMILSIIGVAMALFSLRTLGRIRKDRS